MRSWDARPDTVVCDEPLYARYLQITGLDHPGHRDVIDAGPTNLGEAIDWLTTPPQPPAEIFYQKHMAHHLLPGTDTEWTRQLTNAFLIRDPEEMLTSLLKVIPNPDLDATGLPQQVALFEQETQRLGTIPAVIDGRDVLEQPEATLRKLCSAISVSFLDDMLAWAPGPRSTDGVWAPHWYASVERSTGFAAYRPKNETVPARFTPMLRECRELYQRLAEHKLRANML